MTSGLYPISTSIIISLDPIIIFPHVVIQRLHVFAVITQFVSELMKALERKHPFIPCQTLNAQRLFLLVRIVIHSNDPL